MLEQTFSISADFHEHLLPLAIVLAQKIRDIDVIGDMQQAFQHFIKSGQVWALLIGIFFGYLIRGFTSY